VPTLREYHENTGSVLVALGELPPDATIAQRLAAADALTDAEILARSERLLKALGQDTA
jgi:hypothetical protein